MHRAWVLLGSNIDKETNLPAAVAWLRQRAQVVAVSQVYETTPVGLREQPDFFNAAVLIETGLSAQGVMDNLLRPLEAQLGRVRSADKNAPRTIDADLILYDQAIFDLGQRHIPDPDLLQYPHVAVPIAELTPDGLHPETHESLGAIARRLTGGDANKLRPRPDIQITQRRA